MPRIDYRRALTIKDTELDLIIVPGFLPGVPTTIVLLRRIDVQWQPARNAAGRMHEDKPPLFEISDNGTIAVANRGDKARMLRAATHADLGTRLDGDAKPNRA